MSEVFLTEERVSVLGRFASELGGYIELYGDWLPGHEATGEISPDQAAQEMLGIAGYLGAVYVPLEESKMVAMKDTEKRFETETTPGGDDWEKLSEKYRKYKVEVEGYPDEILTRESLLRDTAPSGWIVIGPTLVYDPHVLPKDSKGFPYGALHQEGGKSSRHKFEKQFKLVGKEDRRVEIGEKRIGGLPARPFIGLSDEAVAEIGAVFERWADRPIGYQAIVGGRLGPRIATMPGAIPGEYVGLPGFFRL